jgi:hypothetical protein
MKIIFTSSSCEHATSDSFRDTGEQLSGKSDTHRLWKFRLHPIIEIKIYFNKIINKYLPSHFIPCL